MKQLNNYEIKPKQSVKTQIKFPISWALDQFTIQRSTYKGYEAGRKPSDVSGLPRLYYDRSKPLKRDKDLSTNSQAKNFIKKPKAYIIPQGWWKVIELLKLNKVQMRQLKKDTTIEVEVYHIDDYKTSATTI